MRTWTPRIQFGRLPIAVTFKGSASDTTGATSLTIPSVSASVDDLLMVVSMTDGFVDQGTEFLRTNLTWGSFDQFGTTTHSWQQYEFSTGSLAVPVNNVSVDGTRVLVQTDQTNSVVVDYSLSVPSSTKVAAVFTITGLSNPTRGSSNDPNDFWYFLNQTNTFGTSTNPVATPVLIRKAESVVIGAVGITGPSSDATGTWNNGFTRITRVGTTGGTPNITLDLGYVITDAIATITADLSGITSRPWLTVPTIFDRS